MHGVPPADGRHGGMCERVACDDRIRRDENAVDEERARLSERCGVAMRRFDEHQGDALGLCCLCAGVVGEQRVLVAPQLFGKLEGAVAERDQVRGGHAHALVCVCANVEKERVVLAIRVHDHDHVGVDKLPRVRVERADAIAHLKLFDRLRRAVGQLGQPFAVNTLVCD